MSARWRKLLGGLAIVVFVVAYAAAAAMVFDRLPDQPLVRLAYMAVVGILWGLPLIPLIQWMNRGR